ncbi:SpvB/TcaC N-terminal domain-containing protein, partial [Myxococcota bacterium]
VCPVCIPDCAGRICGEDPVCGKPCGEPCPSDEFCGPAGQCMTAEEPAEVQSSPAYVRDAPQAAAAIEGRFSDSDRGTATYEVPIAVPPGRGGAQPNPSLRYSGTRDNGLLGVGWSLQGLSTITRCPALATVESYARPVDLTDSDRFCLDGKRLVAVRDSQYGAPEAEYRTEIDTFARIRSYGQTEGGGPEYFKVWTQSGDILSYGATADSSEYANVSTGLKRTWALKTIERRNGSVITVEYANRTCQHIDRCDDSQWLGSLEIHPTRIRYGGHPAQGIADDRYVEFIYGHERPDPITGFVRGVGYERTRLLRRIDTFAQGRRVRSYSLAYGTDAGDGSGSETAANGQSILTELYECAPTNSESDLCKRPTRFAYYEDFGLGGGE